MPAALRIDRAEVEAELARRSLPDFIRTAWPLVEPNAALVWNWHLNVLCDLLAQVSSGEIRRLIINVPPGTAKSLIVSVFWPAWEWASAPGLRFLCASYGAHLSIRDNLRVRDIVTSEWYQRHYALRLCDSQAAKVRFDTTNSGWRIATSVGGVGTGEHPDRVIIDDPVTAEQARSDVERERANTWFDRTISTRGVTRETRVVIIMQRLHETDLTGHLLSRGGWEHLCLPMRYEPSRPATDQDDGHVADPRDWRTEAGELLWPELFPEAVVRRLELDLGPFASAGQLQQRPAPEGGGLFRREWFGVVDVAPVAGRRVRGWDTAGTESGGDWTAGVRLCEHEGAIYVEDVAREQLGPAGVDDLIQATASLDGKACAIREEKEGGSSGLAVTQARAKSLAGHDYAGVPVTGDKVTRARPFRAQCEAGNVKLVRGGWNEEYIRELCSFPVGAHDDQVDASSCAYNSLIADRPKQTRGAWGRKARERAARYRAQAS